MALAFLSPCSGRQSNEDISSSRIRRHCSLYLASWAWGKQRLRHRSDPLIVVKDKNNSCCLYPLRLGPHITIQEGGVWTFLRISYLFPVKGSLGLPSPRKARVGLLAGHLGMGTWPLRPLTLVERVAGESEPWPGFRGKGDSGVPHI